MRGEGGEREGVERKGEGEEEGKGGGRGGGKREREREREREIFVKCIFLIWTTEWR
jgi:hypothetical protein